VNIPGFIIFQEQNNNCGILSKRPTSTNSLQEKYHQQFQSNEHHQKLLYSSTLDPAPQDQALVH